MNGTLPLWCPNVFAGHPHAAFPVTAVFYLPDFLYLILPLGAAINWSAAIHIMMAGIFTYLFCREIKLAPAASLLGAMTFMLNGFFMAHLSLGHIGIVRTSCYLPAVFYFVERGLARSDWRSYLAAGVALALQILCGHTQFYFYTILFLGGYVALRVFLFENAKDWGRRFFFAFLAMFSVVGIAICLSLFQLLLSFEFTQLSDRAAPTVDLAAFGSFHPSSLLRLVFPTLTLQSHSMNVESFLYGGILPLGTAAFAVLACGKKNKYVPVFCILAALVFVLMLGEQTPAFYLYYYLMPGIKFFRIHSRSVLVFVFCLSVLSAIGAHELFFGKARREAPWSFRITLGILAAAALALTTVLVFAPDSVTRTVSLNWYALQTIEKAVTWKDSSVLLSFTWLVMALTILYCLGRFGSSRNVGFVVVGFVWLDLFITLHGNLKTMPIAEFTKPNQFAREAMAAEGLFRVWFPTELYPSNRAIVHALDNMNGYSPLILRRYGNYLSTATGIRPARTITNHLDIRMFEDLPSGVARLYNVRFAVLVNPEEGTHRFSEKLRVTPRAYLVSNYHLAESEAIALSIVSDRNFDPLDRVVLENPPEIEIGDSGFDFDSRVLSIYTSTNEIEISYQAASPKLLVLSEHYYPGWKATLDGNPVKIYRANYLLRAIEAPAGAHTVRFYFQPSGLLFGLPISFLTLSGIITALTVSRRSKACQMR